MVGQPCIGLRRVWWDCPLTAGRARTICLMPPPTLTGGGKPHTKSEPNTQKRTWLPRRGHGWDLWFGGTREGFCNRSAQLPSADDKRSRQWTSQRAQLARRKFRGCKGSCRGCLALDCASMEKRSWRGEGSSRRTRTGGDERVVDRVIPYISQTAFTRQPSPENTRYQVTQPVHKHPEP